IAAILMQNPLAGIGALPQGAVQAQAAIDQGRKIGAGTPRERDYIEAVAAYYEDFAARPERARQESRAKAFEALAARYPDDAAALAAMERAFAVKVAANAGPVVAYPIAAMPARYAVERGDWRAAMQLVPPPGGTPFTQALSWYAKALGAARSGDVAAAEQAA